MSFERNGRNCLLRPGKYTQDIRFWEKERSELLKYTIHTFLLVFILCISLRVAMCSEYVTADSKKLYSTLLYTKHQPYGTYRNSRLYLAIAVFNSHKDDILHILKD
jgi:hypothetical protein